MNSLQKLLIMLMDKSKLSDRQIADKCYITKRTIYNIRKNKHKTRRDTAMCIINGLGYGKEN